MQNIPDDKNKLSNHCDVSLCDVGMHGTILLLHTDVNFKLHM